jgi:hypothetical protein
MPGLRLISPRVDAAADAIDAAIAPLGLNNGEQIVLLTLTLAAALEEVPTPTIVRSALQFILKFCAEPEHAATRAEMRTLARLCHVAIENGAT